jgi:hypothetical protein
LVNNPKVTVQQAGDGIAVLLPSSVGSALAPGANVRAIPHGQDALVLVRESLGSTGYFAGSLSCLSLAEVLGHILTGTRNGTLIVGRGSVRRSVDFRDGQIVFGTSTEAYERLGAILVRGGVVTRSQLESALSQVTEGVKLGQVLTRSGAITPHALYRSMTDLIREMVLAMFELTSGDFLFLEGTALSEDALKLPQSTRSLVIEAIKRGEELEKIRKRIPSLARLVVGKGPAPESSHPLLAKVGSGVEVGALRQFFEGPEYSFLQWVDSLVRSGALIQRAPSSQPPPKSGKAPSTQSSALQLCASLIKTICEAFKAAGQDLSHLQSFFKDPLPGMEEAFAGVKLSEDGQLDLDRVIKNMGEPATTARRAKAYEALDAFMSYALFSAKNIMPAERAEAFRRDCRRIQAALRQ